MLKDDRFQKAMRFLIFYFLLIFSIGIFIHSYARAEEAIGKFTYIEGTVDVLRKGSTPALLVTRGDPVYVKDIIRTKSGSKAEVTFVDGNILRIAQRSRIDMSEYVTEAGKGSAVIQLPRGKVQAIVPEERVKQISISPKANRFEIHTPNAVAGVRGTDFFIDFENNVTKVLVKDGKVYILNPRFPNIVLTVEAGQISWVTLDRPPEAPRPATDKEKEWYEKEVGPEKGAGGIYPLQTADLYDLVVSWLQQAGIIFPFEPSTPSITEMNPQLLSGEEGPILPPSSLWMATQANPYPKKEEGLYSLGTTQFSITGFGYPPEGGAYYKSLGGIVVDNDMEGRFVGLYIDPSGNAGFLRSSGSFLGTGDPSTNMFEINGGIYPEQMVSSANLGIEPENLDESIWEGSGSRDMSGSFATGGFIKDPEGIFFHTKSIATQPWGIYDFTESGTFSNPNADTIWTAKIGGSAEFGTYTPADSDPVADSGYWLADVNGTWGGNKIGGTLSGKFITYTKLGIPPDGGISGDLLGTYIGNGNGTWQAVSLGTWSGTPLTFLSDPEASFYYFDGCDLVYDGYLSALMGGTTSLWTGSSTDVTMIGTYYPGYNQSHIWRTGILSSNYINSSPTTYDGGSYSGYFGGIKLDTGLGTDNMEAKLIALYIDPERNAGFLRGSLTGTGYRNINMFEMDGSVIREQKVTDVGINPSELGNYLWYGYMAGVGDYYSLYGDFGGSGTIWGWISDSETHAIQTQPWGIYGLTLYGSYSSSNSTWNAKLGGEGVFGAYEGGSFHDDWGFWLLDVGGTWTNNIMKGTASGRFITYTKLGEMEGDWLGTYNGGTWQAVVAGTWSGTSLAFSGKIVETSGEGPWFGIQGLIGSTTPAPDPYYSVIPVDLALGKYVTFPESYWSAKAGGEISFSGYNPKDRGYWIADVYGDPWSSGVMPNITFDGFFISPAGIGYISTGEGSFSGNYYEGIKMWKAPNIALTVELDTPFAGYGYVNINNGELGWLKGIFGHVEPLDLSQGDYPQLFSMGRFGDYQGGTEQAKIGGTGWANDGRNYYFVGDIDPWYLEFSNVRFLHQRYMGTLGGYILSEGTYWDDDIKMWQDDWGELWVESLTPLTFVSWVSAQLTHTSCGTSDGSIEFRIGGIDNLWTASQEAPASLLAIGRYFSGTNPQHVWGAPIESLNCENGTSTTYDGGAYKGFINGIEIRNNFEGRMVALYIDPSGNAGYLKGSLTGAGYPEVNMFEMDGTIYPTEKVINIGVAPESLSDYIWENYPWGHMFGSIGAWGSMNHFTDSFYTQSFVNNTTAQPWGIYAFNGFGSYSNWEGGTPWNAKTNGQGGFGAYYSTYSNSFQDDEGYWLADITGTWDANRIAGTLSGRFITYTKLGTISGDVLGSYNDDPNYTLQLFSSGIWEGTPLTFVSALSAELISFDGANPNVGRSFTGLMGGTDSLWTATQDEPASSTIMMHGWFVWDLNPGHIWWSYLKSHNYINNTDTTYDGGAYRGFIGGMELGDFCYSTYYEGRMAAIYVDPSGHAGYLKGSFAGDAYPNISVQEMTGGVYPVQIYDSIPEITRDTLVSSLTLNSYGLSGSGTFDGGGSININSTHSGQYKYSTPGQELAVWRNEVYGTYTGTTSDTWSLETTSNATNYLSGTYTAGAQWSSNKLSGSTVGYGADITSTPRTWISVGETLGTFNPNNYSFQAVQIGLNLETSKFLWMVDNAPTTLQKLNIPCVEVGMVNMSGSGNNLTVNMNNVKFFAPTTGGRPSIWATGSVNGTYSANPVLGIPVAISGNGLSSNFTVQQWNTGTNRWLSTISNGTGSIVGGGSNVQNLSFKGAGAGTINQGAGTFSGTAAGVAK